MSYNTWDTFASVSSPRKIEKLEDLERMFVPDDIDDIDRGNEDVMLTLTM